MKLLTTRSADGFSQQGQTFQFFDYFLFVSRRRILSVSLLMHKRLPYSANVQLCGVTSTRLSSRSRCMHTSARWHCRWVQLDRKITAPAWNCSRQSLWIILINHISGKDTWAPQADCHIVPLYSKEKGSQYISKNTAVHTNISLNNTTCIFSFQGEMSL